MVKVDSQKHIDFSLTSPFGGGRPGRVKRRNQKAAAKKASGGDGDEDDEEWVSSLLTPRVYYHYRSYWGYDYVFLAFREIFCLVLFLFSFTIFRIMLFKKKDLVGSFGLS